MISAVVRVRSAKVQPLCRQPRSHFKSPAARDVIGGEVVLDHAIAPHGQARDIGPHPRQHFGNRWVQDNALGMGQRMFRPETPGLRGLCVVQERAYPDARPDTLPAHPFGQAGQVRESCVATVVSLAPILVAGVPARVNHIGGRILLGRRQLSYQSAVAADRFGRDIAVAGVPVIAAVDGPARQARRVTKRPAKPLCERKGRLTRLRIEFSNRPRQQSPPAQTYAPAPAADIKGQRDAGLVYPPGCETRRAGFDAEPRVSPVRAS